MRQRDDRVEELEEALRESVKITAEREMVMAEQETKIQQTEMKVTCLIWIFFFQMHHFYQQAFWIDYLTHTWQRIGIQ